MPARVRLGPRCISPSRSGRPALGRSRPLLLWRGGRADPKGRLGARVGWGRAGVGSEREDQRSLVGTARCQFSDCSSQTLTHLYQAYRTVDPPLDEIDDARDIPHPQLEISARRRFDKGQDESSRRFGPGVRLGICLNLMDAEASPEGVVPSDALPCRDSGIRLHVEDVEACRAGST